MITRCDISTVGSFLLRWAARLSSLASLSLLAMFATSGGVPSPTEVVALMFFPIGVAVGFVVAWWREGIGGTISLASLGVFYLWLLLVRGHFPGGPYFALFTSPGILFLMSWLMTQARRPRAAANCM